MALEMDYYQLIISMDKIIFQILFQIIASALLINSSAKQYECALIFIGSVIGSLTALIIVMRGRNAVRGGMKSKESNCKILGEDRPKIE